MNDRPELPRRLCRTHASKCMLQGAANLLQCWHATQQNKFIQANWNSSSVVNMSKSSSCKCFTADAVVFSLLRHLFHGLDAVLRSFFPHCCFTDLLIQAGIPRATLSKLLTLADAANGLQSFPASLRWAQQHAWTCQSSFEVWHRKKLLTNILLWVFFLGSVFFLVFTAFWGFQR